MRKWDGKQYRDMTAEEIAERQADAEKAEREYWEDIPYDEAVNAEFRKDYPQHKVEAIQNNYLKDPTNEEYRAEFWAMQDRRAEVKAFVRKKKGIVN
jgi:hypothetical protein